MGLSDWLKRDSEIFGTVLFPGPIPVRADHFQFLSDHGFTIQKQPALPDFHWSLKISHKDFGNVDVVCPRDNQDFQHLLDGAFMTEEGREAIAKAGSVVKLRLTGRSQHILEDRKQALRLYHLLLGEYGLAAIDDIAFKVWSKPQLEDELSHNASLDVADIFGVHAVFDDAGTYWMHTHGLGEIGFYDFDIVEPSESLLSPNGLDTLRAIAVCHSGI